MRWLAKRARLLRWGLAAEVAGLCPVVDDVTKPKSKEETIAVRYDDMQEQ